jgi:hypothetical protein
MARRLTNAERDLISFMLNGTDWWLEDDAQVEDMSDGGMGSLRFASSDQNRNFGAAVSSAQFVDSDGIPVIATINVDQQSHLFELDIWKVDFSPLRLIPPPLEVQILD